MNTLQNRHPNTRHKWYHLLRRFCLYRRRHEPDCFVPSTDGAAKLQPAVIPVIVELGQITSLLAKASALASTSVSPQRGPALRLAIVLLYTCGLRLGELLRLTMEDMEDHRTVLRIRASKFHKSRLVPLSKSTTRELQTFLLRPDRRRHAGLYGVLPRSDTRRIMQSALRTIGLGFNHRAVVYDAKGTMNSVLRGMNLRCPIHILNPFVRPGAA
ncbi:MAG: tyrosine-type recombinase/integrase [Verrucomicrobia bacterium]|nr:tyrosine-type recombinase/integrase [Verrucomicrobiota bacterium]